MCENLDFGRNFAKISILVEFSRKSRFWSRFVTNFGFGRNFRKSRFWSKCFKNHEFIRYFQKIPILFEIFETFPFWSKFGKNHDFGQILRKSRFQSICAKISISVEIFKKILIMSKFSKISILFVSIISKFAKIEILVKFGENLILGRNERKSRFWSKICKKILIWSKFTTNLGFGREKSRKILILVEKFGQNFEKSWSRFRSKYKKISKFEKSLEKSLFWSKFSKISTFA